MRKRRSQAHRLPELEVRKRKRVTFLVRWSSFSGHARFVRLFSEDKLNSED